MRVGICWTGSPSHRNDANRSLPRKALGPLAAVDGVTWVCLAKDAWDPELAKYGMVNGLEGCLDWFDTAQVVRALDLVITVDTAIAHLCGGLGVRTWVLLAAVPDMRWMLGRSDTPWYRSVRLYRQHVAGDWAAVVEQLAHDLRLEVGARKEAA